jgi:predicted DNA-binding transcriptional regulator YafY
VDETEEERRNSPLLPAVPAAGGGSPGAHTATGEPAIDVRAAATMASMPGARSPPSRHLLRLARALASERRVHLRYRDAQGESSERDADALALAFRGGRWLLAAWCRHRDAFRLFRVDRIERSRVLPLPSDPGRAPPGFDARFFSSVGHLEPGGEHPVLVTVRLGGSLAPFARGLFPAALLEHPSPDAVLCHLRATHPAEVARLVVSLGPGAELLQPPEARAAAAALREAPP